VSAILQSSAVDYRCAILRSEGAGNADLPTMRPEACALAKQSLENLGNRKAAPL